jgi:hypothetical protein
MAILMSASLPRNALRSQIAKVVDYWLFGSCNSDSDAGHNRVGPSRTGNDTVEHQ